MPDEGVAHRGHCLTTQASGDGGDVSSMLFKSKQRAWKQQPWAARSGHSKCLQLNHHLTASLFAREVIA